MTRKLKIADDSPPRSTATLKLQDHSSAFKTQSGATRRLLDWYDRHRRDLPWRAGPNEPADAYRVMVSEAMLQQTTVATVEPRFEAFIARFPSVRHLAEAALDDVLHAWQGLGYYRRARNLHKAARQIVEQHQGRVPQTPETLKSLAGIGDYSAAAIAAIAFDHPILPVDGNVVRVLSRFLGIDEPADTGRRTVMDRINAFVPGERNGDAAQALMELGALVCRPRSPGCLSCPWHDDCYARREGLQESLPRPKVKRDRPECFAIAFIMSTEDGRILLRKRPQTGLLAGMIDLPSSDFERTRPIGRDEIEALAPARRQKWRMIAGEVRHIFTHRALNVRLAETRVATTFDPPAGCFWHRTDDLASLALPTLSKKLLAHAGRTG